MSESSIGQTLLGATYVVCFVAIYIGTIVFARRASFVVDYTRAGAHTYSATQYICASMHTGRLDPRYVIDRLENRHQAKLPELGINTGRIYSEARRAVRRRTTFAAISLVVPIWMIAILVSSVADFHRNDFSLFALLKHLSLPLLLMTLIGFVHAVEVNAYLRRRIIPLADPFDNDTKQNVSIYGGFLPFAGYGDDQDGWSLALDVTKAPGERSVAPRAFEPIELLDHVTRALEANVDLGDASDRLFIHGARIRDNPLFLHDATSMPNTALSPKLMRARIGMQDKDGGRHYRVFSTAFGHGHLFLTYFFRAVVVGNKLFIELQCFMLMPINIHYTELNELPVRRGLLYHLGLLARELAMSPLSWIDGLRILGTELSRLQTTLAHAVFGDPRDKLKMRQQTYNYGHSQSLRESLTARFYSSYFQKLDRDMIDKTCQHVIVNSIIDFLDARGISTEDIRERRVEIFNNGLIVHGGVVNAHQLVVGQKASIRNMQRKLAKAL